MKEIPLFCSKWPIKSLDSGWEGGTLGYTKLKVENSQCFHSKYTSLMALEQGTITETQENLTALAL